MLPKDFLDRMKQSLTAQEYQEFIASSEKPEFKALRANALKKNKSGKTAAEVFAVGEENMCDRLKPVPWAENGYYYEADLTPGKHPYHEAGVYYIQEPSAMAPVGLLQPRPGERILDLCASPGGKTTQIASFMEGEGILIANEIHPMRAKNLSENVERMGIRNAVVTNETPQNLLNHLEGYFDKILVDAPCSGEGMFRKNEEAAGEWSLENVEGCGQRQDEILDCAAGMLSRGGILVYSTCTFAPTENEGSIYRFLLRHPEFRLLDTAQIKEKMPHSPLANGRPAWVEYQENQNPRSQEILKELPKTLRLWPQYIDGEGHYAAILYKDVAPGEEPGLSPETNRKGRSLGATPLGGYEAGVTGAALALYDEFVKETLTEDCYLYAELAEEYKGGKSAMADRLHESKSGTYKERGGKASKGKTGGAAGAMQKRFSDGSSVGFLFFGENLYRTPAGMPSLKGLKVLRPGLQLGCVKKDRFEPSHALALSLDPAFCKQKMNLTIPEAEAYLNGMTITLSEENAENSKETAKGWNQILVNGYSLGWGKLAGGIMKNHYPKGLRK